MTEVFSFSFPYKTSEQAEEHQSVDLNSQPTPLNVP